MPEPEEVNLILQKKVDALAAHVEKLEARLATMEPQPAPPAPETAPKKKRRFW
jgi:hypothetical protein